MRLVDTSAWIEWLIGSPVGTALTGELPDRGQWLVPTIVQLELAKWLRREVGELAAQGIAFGQFGRAVNGTVASSEDGVNRAAHAIERGADCGG